MSTLYILKGFMIDSVAWATVCTYGASLSALDRKVFREIKNMDRDASYLVLAHQVLFAGRNTQSLALEGPAPKPNTLFKLSDPTAWIYSLNKSRLYKTIQFFPLHLCLTPAVGTGHRCSDENPAFPFMDESIYDPEFLVYYLLILLRYHPCNVAADRKFLRLFFSHHCFAVLVVMLSSECPYMREGAFQCLDIFSKRIFLLPNIVNEDFPEMRLVRWLSTLVQNIFSEQDRRDVSSGKTQLAPIVARLFAEYANVLTVENHQQPSALSSLPSFSIALYSELVKILISHSTLISNDLPIFTNFWFSTIPESAPVKRSFILKILRQGMKNSLDEEIFRKRHIIEHLLVHLLSISSASCLPDMVAILEVRAFY